MNCKRGVFCWLTVLSVMLLSVPVSATTKTFRLTDFFAGDSTLRMAGKASEVTLQIPLSGNADVADATLTLNTHHSLALIAERSILSVRFNNATIGQIVFSPNQPVSQSRVTIPHALWRKGFNALTFAVSQHYADMCETPNAPELWSEIDLYTSTLSIDSQTRIERLALSTLSEFFHPGIGGQRHVTLFSSPSAEQEIQTRIVPLVVQGLALRNQYRPLDVAHRLLPEGYRTPAEWAQSDDFDSAKEQAFRQSSWYFPEADSALHVLVGTRDTLADFVSSDVYNAISGAYIGVESLPAFSVNDTVVRKRSYRLIVSGTNEDEVNTAALGLSVMDDALNPQPATQIAAVSPLSTEQLLKSHVLSPGNTYTFEEMGVGSEVMRGANSYAKRISFSLPADFYVPESATVKLFLDFGYGAGLGLGSMMNVLVNGELIHGLNLNNENGQSFRDYQLNLPARLLKGGANNIDIEVTMQAPLVGKPCAEIKDGHLVFQILDQSRIALPDAGSVAVQPDLNLFAETVFPLVRYRTNTPSEIVFSEASMFDSALTLTAKLAQVTRTPILNLQVRQSDGSDVTGSAIVLGTPQSLANIEQSEFASAIAKANKWPYRLQNSLHNRVRQWANDESHKAMRVSGQTLQYNELGDTAVLMVQANAQASSTQTLFLLAAQSSEIMAQRVADLTSLELWGQLAGDFFVWNTRQQPELVMQVNDKFAVGEANDTVLTIRMWLSNNPWYWLGAFVLLVLLVSLLSYILLKRRNQKTRQSW